jgi:hypothetical protein
MNRLNTIAVRQRNSMLRDMWFAAAVAFAAVISVATVSTAVHAASTHISSR